MWKNIWSTGSSRRRSGGSTLAETTPNPQPPPTKTVGSCGIGRWDFMARLLTYLSFVRFSHSVFALPFALTGALLAWRVHPFSWRQAGWIVVCMVAARSAAMGFNRLVDARWDALNPRTAMRELPRGLMSRWEATL